MRVISLLALAAALHAAPAVAQNARNCGAELNYEDAELRAVVDEMALRTGRTFLLDPRVQGKVTIKSPPNGGLCADEAWELFQAILRVNNAVATPIGGSKYKIVPLPDAQRSAGPVGKGAPGDFVTEIVRLQHVDAREAAANLGQIISERGVAAPIQSGNAIILVDTVDNIVRLKEVLSRIDRDTSVYRTIPLANAAAADVARVLTGLAREMTEEGGGARAAPVSILPVEASNSVLLRAEPSVVGRLESVVAELDRIGAAKADLSVIYLNHADAEELAALLKEVANAQEQTMAGEGTPPVAGRARAAITFHKPTNSVIINGDADIQRTLQNVIAKLDVRRAQVLIEAIIVEISDTTARELGVQYFFTGVEGSAVPFASTNYRNGGPNILSLAGPALIETGHLPDSLDGFQDELIDAALNSLLSLNGFGLGAGGKIGDQTVFSALLNAIQQDDTSNVLSTPSVVTLDNQKAELSVGQEIPITTGEAVGDNFQNAFRTVSREEVGTILEVTPQINEGGTVTLEIRQETSSIAGPILATSTDLITNKRVITTTALVDDGDILVIGGLIDESDVRREDKVPVLGDIPVAGNLFKSSSRSKGRRNLMVFIRPTILRDRETAESATKKKLDYVRGREMMYDGGARSSLDRLIRDVTGTAPADADPDE